MKRVIVFFIGTEAELIKMFPVIMECEKRKLPYYIVASGQNDVVESRIFKDGKCGMVGLELSDSDDIQKNTVGLLKWFVKTIISAKKQVKKTFEDVDWKNSCMIVHGDTISTVMGAWIGRTLGMTVCHVEAGLRSHNFFNPFPEEIDRMITSKLARVHFAPGKEAFENLSKCKGKIINTENNTLIDSLNYSKQIPIASDVQRFLEKEYFLFVMHRQENLANTNFVIEVVEEIDKLAKTMNCVVLLHEITKNTFEKLGLMYKLRQNPNIIFQSRVNYFDFMKVLEKSQFVITDGGSNQEELHYMGKPCLILRKNTERFEGLDSNAVMYKGEVSQLSEFARNYKEKEGNVKVEDNSPSVIIVETLLQYI